MNLSSLIRHEQAYKSVSKAWRLPRPHSVDTLITDEFPRVCQAPVNR